MSDKQIGCTQFTDRECRKEDCCITKTNNYSEFDLIDIMCSTIKPVYEVNCNWSISCEK